MTKREWTLYACRVAGYHQDRKTFTRLFIEGRANAEAKHAAYRNGMKAKEAGVKCTCRECNPLTA